MEVPTPIQHRKGHIREIKEKLDSARVKGDLPIVFTDEKLSAYGGIELLRRFVDRSGFCDRLQNVFSIRQFDGDYGSFRVTLALMGMLLLGGTRLRHLQNLERDPLLLRFAPLHRLPTDRTVSNTLKETTRETRDRIGSSLRSVAYDTAREAELSRVTHDLDGTMLRTGLFAEGAERGFNLHHPKDKSHYPLTAHLAQTGQLLAVLNREGNIHDSEKALETLEFLVGSTPFPRTVELGLLLLLFVVRVFALFSDCEIVRCSRRHPPAPRRAFAIAVG